MELSIQERLKDLRVERGLTLEQLAEQTHLSKSAWAVMKRRTSRTSATMHYQAGEVLRRDRRLSAGAVPNKKSPKRRSCRPASE